MTTLSAVGSAPDRIISERTTAEILDISPDTLRRLSRRGEGPTRRKLSPRRVGYKLSEVEAYRDRGNTNAPVDRADNKPPTHIQRRARSARRRPRTS
jgi:predicted DNA-binding transcriptional regulator AlpA